MPGIIYAARSKYPPFQFLHLFQLFHINPGDEHVKPIKYKSKIYVI